MASIKTFSLGGLDKKSNDLTRAPEKASDMLNMEYDTQSSLKKRNGYELFKTITSNDLIYYGYKKEFLSFQNGSSNLTVIKSDASSRVLSFPSGIPSLADVSISYTENQNNIYFTNTDLTTYVMKYDGSNVYRAGLPAPRKEDTTPGQPSEKNPSWASPASGLYSRVFYSFKDINGNITYSPYYQYDSTGGNLTVASFKTSTSFNENGFLSKYCYRASGSSATISSSSLTLTVTRHNYVAGEKFLIDTENKFITISPEDRAFVVLDVESVTATSITFSAASVGTNTITFASTVLYASEYPVDVRSKVHVGTSASADTGYNVTTNVLDNSIVNNTINALLGSDLVLIGENRTALDIISFEDLYDSTTLKIMPPICSYIASFGNQIVYGKIQSFFSISTKYSSYPNQKIAYTNQSLIVYSDTSTADGPEGVSELNLEKIGETWDGDITGLRRCNDSMVVFKSRGVFTIDGTLIAGEYQLRKINTNFVGCTSHKSILESDDGLYFQGHNGIYYTNGIGVKKLTYEIDSVIGSADYLTTRSVRLKKKQKALFYIPELSKVVVLDYYYNQIYFWDNIDASKGIVEDSSGDVYFNDGTSIYKFNNGYLDGANSIPAYYSTTWHHAGEPSLNKKWLSMRFFALTSDVFTATVTTQGDWDTSKTLTTNSMTFSSSDQTKFLMLDMQTKRSLRVTFSNNVANENLAITGYELTFERFNDVDKN